MCRVPMNYLNWYTIEATHGTNTCSFVETSGNNRYTWCRGRTADNEAFCHAHGGPAATADATQVSFSDTAVDPSMFNDMCAGVHDTMRVMREELQQARNEMRAEIQAVRTELQRARNDMRGEIQSMRSEMRNMTRDDNMSELVNIGMRSVSDGRGHRHHGHGHGHRGNRVLPFDQGFGMGTSLFDAFQNGNFVVMAPENNGGMREVVSSIASTVLREVIANLMHP